jgi:hypothetical protein
MNCSDKRLGGSHRDFEVRRNIPPQRAYVTAAVRGDGLLDAITGPRGCDESNREILYGFIGIDASSRASSTDK